MSADFSPNPRAELEAKITAWLLGELSADEAARLEEMIGKDAELRQLRERLVQTLNLLRETVATPVGETPAQPAPLKLSPAKREKLLAHLKTIRPEEFEKKSDRFMARVVFYAAVLMMTLMLASMLLPALSKAKQKAQRISSVNNLLQIETAKQMWAEDNNQRAGATPSLKDLQPYLGGSFPNNPHETYYIGAVGQPPVAEVDDGRGRKKIITLPGNESSLAASAAASAPAATLKEQIAPPTASVAPAPATPAPEVALEAPQQNQIVLPQQGEQQNNNQQQNIGQQNQVAVNYDTGTGAAVQQQSHFQQNLQQAQEAEKKGFNSTTTLDDWQGRPPETAKPVVTPGLARNAGESGKWELGEAPQVGGQFSNSSSDKAMGGRFYANNQASQATDALSQTAAAEDANKKDREVVAVNGILDWPKPTHGAERMVAAKDGSADSSYAPTSSLPSSSANPVGQFPGTAPILGGRASNTPDTNVYSTQAVGYINVTVPPGTMEVTTPLVTNAAGDSVASAAPATPPPALAEAPPAAATPAPVTSGPAMPIHYADALDIVPALRRLAPLVPLPEVWTRTNAFTTFSLDISDVAFKLAQASLENGVMPEPGGMRSEEFINAFDYRDPDPPAGAPIGFAWERAGDPFAHNRDFLRFSIKAAALGRAPGRPLNLVLLLDKSGSMERADRVEIIDHALRVLASQLQPGDTLSVVVFARTAHLFADGVPGSEAGKLAKKLRGLTPEGGTNLEEAMRLAYETALRHYLPNGENRVVLLTDGAANLGNTEPAMLKQKAEANRKQGIALDCFGVGWDGYNDEMLEKLSRAGNGRYGFINTPKEADTEFAGKLAGALRVAANDVKVQVEFNPNRVISYRQIGYAKDQLKTEDFRNNSVKAAQIGAAEAGNALYTVEINPTGDGPLGTVRVRYRVPGTEDYQEHAWEIPYTGTAVPLDSASPAMRLCATAAEFSEWLGHSPYAGDVTPDQLLHCLRGVPQVYGADQRPAKLEWMIRHAKSISGK